MNRQQHWENVYQSKLATEVSWYRDHLENSLQTIVNTQVDKTASIIDVGGGTSTLVDDLLAEGFENISVLDISSKAMEESQKRLGDGAKQIDWIISDITTAGLPEIYYDVWHDRAVFHFFTDAQDRLKYVEMVKRSLKIGGHLIVATFGENGPQKCSGLDVLRYSPVSMQKEFGDAFQLIYSINETHQTPFGTTQEFIYCYFRKVKN